MSIVSRRGFFEGLFDSSQSRIEINTSLDEYTQPLTRLQVLHLLHRATFSVTNSMIDKYVGKKASEVVDELFVNADAKRDPTPPFFVNQKIRNPGNLSGKDKDQEDQKRNLQLGDYNRLLGEWWVQLMKVDYNSVLEKMVLFWHDHFATQYAICNGIPADSMFKQNDLFRKNYAGSFKTLLEKISIDGAMLRYLNGSENVKDAPNENYARELMELFCLGVGNYSEQDIREAAKILTGWKVTMYSDEANEPNEAYLNSSQFDPNTKLFMGEVFSVNYEITSKNVFDLSVKKLINVILTKKGLVSAKFLSMKLYQYFVYANPQKIESSVVDQMSNVLIENKFEIKPVLKTLFKSQHFFDDLNIGVQLKSPAETIIGMVSQFSYNDLYARNIMNVLGLELFNPPNVAGWNGYRNWISTKTLPTTIHFLKEILNTKTDKELGIWAKEIDNSGDVKVITEKILELFIAKSVGENRFLKYQNVLLGGAPSYEWYEIIKITELVGQRVRNLLFEIIKAPDYFLY